MTDNTGQLVPVSRRIEVPADKLLDFLAHPANHLLSMVGNAAGVEPTGFRPGPCSPIPSSRTSTIHRSPMSSTRTWADLARMCFTTLVSASEQTK